jgi:hypothetical protein
MYNLLKGKRGVILVLWMKIQSLGKQQNVFTKKAVFCLTNAPASIRMGSIAELKKLAPQSFLLMRHRLLI